MSEKRSHNGASQTCGKDFISPGSKVKKGTHFPPLFPEKPSLSSLSCSTIFSSFPSKKHLSLVELPRLTAKIGSDIVSRDTKWRERPRMMASALETDMLIRTVDESTTQSFTGKHEPIKVTTCNDKTITTVKNWKETKSDKAPLTGTEVFHFFARKGNLGGSYFLKEVDGDSYRPYDLKVVHHSKAGSEHYIFSFNSVMHVTAAGYGGIVSLTEWYRESVLWEALQKIPFFRDFRLHKAITCWYKNVRYINFQRRCKDLEKRLFIAVPRFRNALFLFTRIIEEVKEAHMLPQEEAKTYTLLDFNQVLKTLNLKCFGMLKKLSHYRTVILNKVIDDTHTVHRELQLHVEYSKKPNKLNEPMYLHVAHQRELKKELVCSERILPKLGNFAVLINQMTVQSLVMKIKTDISSFLRNVLKRNESVQGCLFHTEMHISANNQLILDPPIHLYQEAVNKALLNAGHSIIQICETCGFFQESTDRLFSSEYVEDFGFEPPSYTENNNDFVRDRVKSCCRQVLLSKASPMAQGTREHGCLYPLSKTQLEWQININDVTKQVEEEQANIMQVAELEIQQLCQSYVWMVDVHLDVSQWSQASLVSMKGQPALQYEELMKKIRNWAERINAVPSSVSTSNHLFNIQLTRMKSNLGEQLKVMEQEVLQQLVEQIKLRSESLVSDLEEAASDLKLEPKDLHEVSKYAQKVKDTLKMLADMPKLIEYIHSLQDVVSKNHRKMTEQEVTLEEKMLTTGDCFILVLKQAESTLCSKLPTVSRALDAMFSHSACYFKNTVSKATSEPFIDPTQNAEEMASALNGICILVRHLYTMLEEMSEISQIIQEHPVDSTIFTTDVLKVEARRELWKLIAVSKAWMEEFTRMPFSEVMVSKAQGKITKWKEQALYLTFNIPTNDAVLREILKILDSLSLQCEVLGKLQSKTLKQKHWEALFRGMGRLYEPNKMLMVAELMCLQSETDHKFIDKICKEAEIEFNMEQTFLKLQQGWEARLFQLDTFNLQILQNYEPAHQVVKAEMPEEGTISNLQTAGGLSCNAARLTIIGLEILFAEVDDNLMTLSTMLNTPHMVEVKKQMQEWVQLLQELGKLLHLLERHQQMWAFLTKMFDSTPMSVQRVDLIRLFQPVDEAFQEMMHSISSDPHVLNFVHPKKENDRFHGNSLCQILTDGLSTMETISSQLSDQLDHLREQFPRLFFCSDREVIQLLSFYPTPVTLLPFVKRCFKGVKWLQVDCDTPSHSEIVKSIGATPEKDEQMKVIGVFGSLKEQITFLSPLEPSPNAMAWLCDLENQLKFAMVELVKQCFFDRHQLETYNQDLIVAKEVGQIALPVPDLLSKYPLQCLLVAEEAVWCTTVHQASQELSPLAFSSIKGLNSAKLEILGTSIRDGAIGAKKPCPTTPYIMMSVRALIQLAMNHAQQLSWLKEVKHEAFESSFEWLSLMKYHINAEGLSQRDSDDPTCYVDVFGRQIQYDNEYFGPEDWEMVHTPSTDRAKLGLLLTLTSYRCGFLSGSSKSGKTKTVAQLGKALGRQVVNIQCCPSMTTVVVQQMLLGGLLTGAWVLLDSVDLLTQGALSLLGQHLEDIQQSMSLSMRNRNERDNEEPMDMTAGCKDNVDSRCNVVFVGKSISARLSYGCVLISSKRYTSEVPASLRSATRPIALTHPDYRIIAEVMLTSIGFSEAMSLSRHLATFISLLKKSSCLPDFISDNQTCFLVVLQKIISASEVLLQQSLRQREISAVSEGLAAEQPDLTSSENVTAKFVDKDGEKNPKTSRWRRSHMSVHQGLMEETAVVKAIISVLLPFLYGKNKAPSFYMIFKEVFPIACQFPFFHQYIEEKESNQLKDAVTEELRRRGFQSDTEIVSSVSTLYQTMKFSKAVVLIGPSGCGKTTCYRALAGALNHLAAKTSFESDSMIKEDTLQAGVKTSDSTWNSVETVVLFPNAMTYEESFGFFCEKRGWQDGAVTKVLRDFGRRGQAGKICNTGKDDQTPMMSWLVMDGNPLGEPGWLDFLTKLCSPEDLYLPLPSCEKLPSQSHVKLLIETIDLSDASPSAVTHCSLVHFTNTNLWMAVCRTEMDALSVEHKLHQETLRIWNCLVTDLFSRTLSFLRENALTSVLQTKKNSLMYGLQEIMSFFRILRALLQHFGKELEQAEAVLQIDKTDLPVNTTGTGSTDGNIRQNLFLLAYIWGFSGHLYPRHWPQFDLLARQVLFNCRYKIVVPDEETVFEHFFNIHGWKRPETKLLNCHPLPPLLTNSISPKYQKYISLMDIMLEAEQSVLLAGEPCSGKTTLCKTLLNFDRPHVSLPASPLLSPRDFRTLMQNISYKKNSRGTTDAIEKQPRLLLFVDDLHESPCDVFGKTSATLEMLRQSISKEEILTFDTDNLTVMSSRCIGYMATCCVFGSSHHSDVISPRLSRLFSILVLPSLSIDVIYSIHSPQIKLWLKEEDVARAVITATKTLFDAVYEQFQPTAQRPYFLFSHHDLQKVFSGMCLWRPHIPKEGEEDSLKGSPLAGPAVSVLHIAHLWMHECMRTFGDRLSSDDESKTLVALIAKTAAMHYGVRLINESQPVRSDDTAAITSPAMDTLPADTAGTSKPSEETLDVPEEPKLDCHSDLNKCFALTEPEFLSKDNPSKEASLKTHSVQPQILQDMVSRLVYAPSLSELGHQDDSFRVPRSYQGRELDSLEKELFALINRKYEANGQKSYNNYNFTARFMLHRQRLSQLLHILRVLLIPGGHGVLIGTEKGTGRKTAVRLAAKLTGYQLIEVHAGNEDKLHKILTEAGSETRRKGVSVIILAHEGISQSAREELLVAMAHRRFPGLYTEEELGNRVSRVTHVKISRRCLWDTWIFEKRLGHIHRNVHVILLLPFNTPRSSETPENNQTNACKAQLTKALQHSCCVEVYRPWSNQSLVEVAVQFLKAFPHRIEKQGSEASLSVSMAGIHQSACQYASVVLDTQPFSPQTYTEFIAHFGFLCTHLQEKQQFKANRVTTVLYYMDALNNTAVHYKQELIRLQEEVAETQQRENELLSTEDYLINLFEDAQRRCVEEENKLYQFEEKKKLVFDSNLNILSCLNPSDVEEVCRYRDPPDGVVKVMDAICLLFDHPSGWETAKQLLVQPNFFQELEFFDRYSLKGKKLQQLHLIVHSPQFRPESVREVSKACESLCHWVQAVYERSCLLQQLLSQQQMEEEARRQLCLAIQHKKDVYRRLEDVKQQLELVQDELQNKMLELNTVERLEKESARNVGLFETNVRSWRGYAQQAEENKQTLLGDALILAAVTSYAGPFEPDTRTELLCKWRELCLTGSININPRDPRTSLFAHSDTQPSFPLPGFPIAVSERLQLPLGHALDMHHDAPADRMVVKLLLWGSRRAWVQRWPLLAGAQQQLNSESWLITGDSAELESKTESEMVVCSDDPELLDKLDQAATKGLRVLVTRVECLVPTPQLLARLTRSAVCGCQGFEHNVRPVHPEFCLYLSTDLPVKMLSNKIHPSVLAQVGVVDLSLSSEAMRELMLTQLLQRECKELLIQHLQYKNDKQLLQEKLVSEEDTLMDFILGSNASQLQNTDLLSRVSTCQESMKELQAQILQLDEELEHHESLLTVPRQLMRLAADLYQALQGVSRLSHAYYFSLHGFITLMQESFKLKGRSLVPHTTGKVPKGVREEVTNRMVNQLLLQYRPLLFKSHFVVLKLLVSVTLLQHNELCTEAERIALFRGLQDIEHPATDLNPCSCPYAVSPSTSALPSWIPPDIHTELLCLEKIPAFRGLIASLSTFPTQWQDYLHFPSSTVVGAVPCQSYSNLSLIQRALLWKTVIPNCVEGLAEAMATYHPFLLGQTRGIETPNTGNPKALLQYLVKHEGPIILTLPSPREDKITSIQPLHLIHKLAHCMEDANEVQVKVISFGARFDREMILSVLYRGVTDGSWLVFNNCHLLEQWDDVAVTHLSQLFSSFREEQRVIHPRFRLWFIMQEYASWSIPAAVRLSALPVVCDSPCDLKEELSCSFGEVVSIIQSKSPSGDTADNMDLLLRCAVFHSVLLQRQSYKYLGQGKMYSWSQGDLLALIDAHFNIVSLCHDKTKALHYIAVHLVHGGHVLDSADLELLESVAETCLTRGSPLSGSGPHNLSDMIIDTSNFDFLELLQLLEKKSANINDPLTLGFSSDVPKEIVKINSQNLNILLQASQTPLGALRSLSPQPNQCATLPARSHARSRLQALKNHLLNKDNNTETNVGAASLSPLRDFLQAEWDDLIDSVSSLLSQLQQPAQYSSLTFASLSEFADLSRFERRAELLNAYLLHLNTSDPPSAYRLSAFKNARGFLAAVTREAARVNRKNICDMALRFQVLSDSTPPLSPSQGAVYLSGLELRGASWDANLGALFDTASLQSCSLPLVCVMAQVRSKNISQITFPWERSLLKEECSVLVTPASAATMQELPTYHCPLYLDGEPGGGNCRLTDENIIISVPLRTNLNPVLCILRRVKLVSVL